MGGCRKTGRENKWLYFCTRPHPAEEDNIITPVQDCVNHLKGDRAGGLLLNLAGVEVQGREVAGRSREAADRPFPDLAVLE